jgi:hypothetical protein
MRKKVEIYKADKKIIDAVEKQGYYFGCHDFPTIIRLRKYGILTYKYHGRRSFFKYTNYTPVMIEWINRLALKGNTAKSFKLSVNNLKYAIETAIKNYNEEKSEANYEN